MDIFRNFALKLLITSETMFQNIPTVTKNLLIINLLVFMATWLLEARGVDLSYAGGLHFFMSPHFHFYQFLTYLFLHANFWHLFGNMFALWMFGGVIERVWGPQKFLFYYLCCGIGAGFAQEVVQFLTMSGSLTIGASGAVYAVLLAFGMTFPNERIYIIPFPFPIKAKWFVMGYIALELFNSVNSYGDGVAHMAHLGGMLFGFLLIRYWNRYPGNRYDRSRGQQFFDQLRQGFEQRQSRREGSRHMHAEQGRRAEDDMEYNARKKARQEEIDAILDKIRQSGYDSLTKEEKQKLFEASRDQ